MESVAVGQQKIDFALRGINDFYDLFTGEDKPENTMASKLAICSEKTKKAEDDNLGLVGA